jgi:raffinose/stachyose/melibiose transport system permease protein
LVLFVVGALVFALGFVFTIVLRDMRGRGFVRAAIFFPNIVAPVALAILWGFLLDPSFGLVNTLLRSAGLSVLARSWMAPDMIFKVICLALIWIYTGYYTTIILAGVDKIPSYFYEAADVEGAGPLQKFIHVTLPMTWDVISVAALLWVINAIKMFEFIYAFSGVGDAPTTNVWTLALNMFIISFGNRTPIYRLGYGSAIAVTMVGLVVMAVVLLRRVLAREAIEY